MFCAPSAEEEHTNPSQTNRHSHHSRKKRASSKRKNAKKRNTKNKESSTRLSVAMSAWAENFSMAATWDLKHQVAYWKAKAISLECANKTLHQIIRKRYFNSAIPASQSTSESEAEESSDVIPGEASYDDENEHPDDGDDDDLEVSEEFIEFLRSNAKYREEARKERERLKAKTLPEENSIEQLEAGPSEEPEDVQTALRELYGDQWQRIAALEMSLQSDFIEESDKLKPVYWPNIPLNL